MTRTAFRPLKQISAVPYIIAETDIDTDQILPAKFLTTISRKGLGKAAFHGWRHDNAGRPITDHPLNQMDSEADKILVCARNFGCGSSREHAAWALQDFGVRAVLGVNVADIFKNNALKNGIAVIEIPAASFEQIADSSEESIQVDLETRTIEFKGESYVFEIDAMARDCLISGKDQLDLILAQDDTITRFEQAR